MTVQEEYELSCYEELAQIKENKSVYLVRHIETGRICIKKKIDVYNQSVYLKLKDMKPEGMPRIHFCAERNGKLIVIEDYIQGRSLQDIYDTEGAFSEKQVMDIAWELCNILQKLHECIPPIIHRDIKPSNIMLSDDGVVKLIDFNAAKEFAEGKTEDTQFIGTQEFAAPEQYGFGQSDVRTDIYAIGVTMNYLLTGMVPRKSMYREALGEVIGKCVRLDAADRYQSVREVGINAGVVDLGTRGRTSIEGEYQENAMLDYLKLEEQLKGRDDYFDFMEGGEQYTLDTVPFSSIIKIRGILEIPDGADLINLAEQFWPQILGSIECKDAQERELLNTVLGKRKTKIPMQAEIEEAGGYNMLFSKLNFSNLLIDMDELEEYENSEVSILGRVLYKKELHNNAQYVAYDFYRDFLGLNRALRKELKEDDSAPFQNIILEESFVELDIIGMYV